MRPPDPPPPVTDTAYLAELAEIARTHGVTHTGVAPAAVLSRARAAIEDRLAAGLTDGMQFTFRNPARSTDPERAVHGARSVFVAARPYLLAEESAPDVAVPGEAVPGDTRGRIARYAWVDHYAPLRAALWAVSRRLRADGFKAVPFADDNSIVDREVAHLAGIGWFGKNANILLPGAGSWFVLGCVVTTADLPPAAQQVADGCGGCRRCIDGCPTGAIVADGVIDASRCLAWVLQKPGVVPEHLRAAVGDRLYGCDECQEVCPITARFGGRHLAPAPADGVACATLDVVRLLTADDEEALAAWGSRYLADRDARWVRRNALIVLGNSGPPVGEHVRTVLAEYVAHHDPVLRVHAEWAARVLGITDLISAP